MLRILIVIVLLAIAGTALASCSGGCRPRDCQDLREMGFTYSTQYTIYPDKYSRGVRVRCDMTTDGGGWTVIQRRISNSDFLQTWDRYEYGFGNLNSNFWLGNRNIHKITSQDSYKLRVDMTLSTLSRYAVYNHFEMYDATHKYQVLVNGYYGNAGDSLVYHNGRPFSTKDRDNDAWANQCAVTYTGAWWYGSCHKSNLNGLWGNSTYGMGVNWHSFTGYHKSLTSVEMKVRRT